MTSCQLSDPLEFAVKELSHQVQVGATAPHEINLPLDRNSSTYFCAEP